MASQHHLIKRQILQITVQEAAGAYGLQQKLGLLARSRLTPLIARHCSELSSPDVIHRIDSIEVDLGELPFEDLEEALIKKFDTEFRRKLGEAIAQQSASRVQGARTAAHLELFAYFAQFGTFPWWADTAETGILDKSVLWLVSHAPGAFKPLVNELLAQESYRKRIIQHLSNGALVTLGGLYSRALGAFVDGVFEDLFTVLLSVDGLKAFTVHSLRFEIWSAILLVLRLSSTASSEGLRFIQTLLPHIASHQGIRTSLLLDRMLEATKRLANTRHRFASDLPAILSAIHKQDAISEKNSDAHLPGEPEANILSEPEISRAQGARTGAHLELFAFFAQFGTFPWWADTAETGILDNSVVWLVSNAPGAFKPLVNELLAQESYRKRIIQHLSNGALVTLGGLYSRAPGAFVDGVFEDLFTVLLGVDGLKAFTVHSLRFEIWSAILLVLRLSGTASSEGLRFIQTLLPHIASHQGIRTSLLLDRMLEATKRLANTRHRFASDLPAILSAIHKQDAISEKNSDAHLPGEPEANILSEPEISRAQGARTGAHLELFAFFAQFGTFPWWADTAETGILDNSVVWLVSNAPGAFKPLVNELLAQESYRKRIIQHLSNGALVTLGGLYSRAPGAFVDGVFEDLFTVLLGVDGLKAFTVHSLRFEIWSAILLVLRLSGTASSEGLRFIQTLLPHIASHQGILTSLLLDRMLEATKRLANTGHRFASDLPAILSAIHKQDAISEKHSDAHLPGKPEANILLKPEGNVDLPATLKAIHEQDTFSDTHWDAHVPAEPEANILSEPEISRAQGARAGAHLELFAFFAQFGTFPWWADTAETGILDNSVLWLVSHAPGAFKPLVNELLARESYRKRIIQHLSNEALVTLAGLYTRALSVFLDGVFEDLFTVLLSIDGLKAVTVHSLRFEIWSAILLVLRLSGTASGDGVRFIQTLLPHIASHQGIRTSLLLDRMLEATKRLANTRHRFVSDLPAILTAICEQDAFSEKHLDAHLPDEPEANVLSEPEINMDFHFSDADEAYVSNAGLVILWPFLARFFERLGLLEGRQFKDVAALHRAVRLLQYLADPQQEPPPEYLLLLNKVLCGMAVDEVFDFGLPITEHEKDESGSFLAAVIDQAPILHNMSIPGFRATFLLRKGQLSARDGAWLLRVERETYDVVLDRFPWSVAWVKLPWMEAPMQVDW